MGAVVATIRAELRHRWRRWLSLSALLGLAAGLVLGAATGARRTDSAYPRLLKASHPFDYGLVYISPEQDPTLPALNLAVLAALPEVAETSTLRTYGTPSHSGQPIATDGRFGGSFNTFYPVRGRLYDPTAPTEAVVSEYTARRLKLHIGQALTIPFGAKAIGDTPLKITIVGTIVAPQAFPPRPAGQGDPFFLSPAFPKAYPQLFSLPEMMFRFKRGPADLAAFKRTLDQMAGGKPIPFHIEAQIQDINTERTIHVQAVALWVLAALIGLAMLAALGQSFSRQMFLEAEEHPTLRSIGMSKKQLWGLGIARAVSIGVAGAIVALGVAIGVSWFTPIGIARLAELHKGFVADWVVLSVGFGGVVLLSALLSAWPAWRSAGAFPREAERARPSAVATAAARAGLSPSTVSGIRLGLEPGRGRTAVPVRSTILGVAIGIAAVITSLGFATNLSHLLATPSQYGWNWSRIVTSNTNNAEFVSGEAASIQNTSGVDSSALGTSGVDVSVDDKLTTTAIIMQPPRGDIPLVPVLTGRVPADAHEILLGEKTMRQLHKHIGDTVRIKVFGGLQTGEGFRIVGSGVIPPLSDTGGLGTGVVLTVANAPMLVEGGAQPDTVFVHFARGADAAGLIARAEQAHNNDLDFRVIGLPQDLANFGGVRNLPFVMAALLGGLALILMIHTLVSSIRRRSRDLAILKTIGFARAQLRATVAWQASTLILVSLLVGLPLGAVGARWVWSLFASNLGVVPDTKTPILAIALVVPAALVIANLIAAPPARAAGRVLPAQVFRTE